VFAYRSIGTDVGHGCLLLRSEKVGRGGLRVCQSLRLSGALSDETEQVEADSSCRVTSSDSQSLRVARVYDGHVCAHFNLVRRFLKNAEPVAAI
jgi:hypothetical protein